MSEADGSAIRRTFLAWLSQPRLPPNKCEPAIKMAGLLGPSWPPEERVALADRLLFQASLLQETPPSDHPRLLVMALRKAAALAPFAFAPRFLAYLRPDDDLTVRRSALESLKVMCTAGPPSEPQTELWAGLEAVLASCVREDPAASAELAPLAFAVAVASDMPEAVNFVGELSDRLPLFAAQSAFLLNEILAGWHQAGVNALAGACLQGMIGLLEERVLLAS